MRISDLSSDVCSSDLVGVAAAVVQHRDATLELRGRGREADRRRRLDDLGWLGIDPSEIPCTCIDQHVGDPPEAIGRRHFRSEEHTSELQSLMRISYAVFCLKKTTQIHRNEQTTL